MTEQEAKDLLRKIIVNAHKEERSFEARAQIGNAMEFFDDCWNPLKEESSEAQS